MIKRRDQFVQALLILAYDSTKGDSGSLWSQLPIELTEYIMNQLVYSGKEQIEKSASQLRGCIRYVYGHIGELKGSLQAANERGEGFKVLEKVVGKDSEFRFYPGGKGVEGAKGVISLSEKEERSETEGNRKKRGI
jgi:hypothetical protein